MNMGFIFVGTAYESLFSFCVSHSQVIANFVCLFGRDFARLERYADMIHDNITLALPACICFIFPLRHIKFRCRRAWVTAVCANKFAASGLVVIHNIIKAIPNGLGGVFAL